MKTDAQRRRCEAGVMLVTGCEETLGVRGPTALAALTGRSKAWWSKLASGGAAFPTWEELDEVLPADLGTGERESLHLRYRRAWLWLYDPVLLERLDQPTPVRFSMDDLLVLEGTASVVGYVQGDHRTALRLLKIEEMLLVARGVEALSREELFRLRECLDHQSVCEGNLGNYLSSIAVARRSAAYQQAGGDRLSELPARHTLGLALHKADLRPRGDYLARAAGEFEALEREYQRLGMTHEIIRARRDKAITLIYLGRRQGGEAELVGAYEVPRQGGEDQFLTVMWLAAATAARGDAAQTRRWLARLRVISRRHPDDAARLMRFQYISRHVAQLERDAAESRPARR
jgi:hypothetical protein